MSILCFVMLYLKRWAIVEDGYGLIRRAAVRSALLWNIGSNFIQTPKNLSVWLDFVPVERRSIFREFTPRNFVIDIFSTMSSNTRLDLSVPNTPPKICVQRVTRAACEYHFPLNQAR